MQRRRDPLQRSIMAAVILVLSAGQACAGRTPCTMRRVTSVQARADAASGLIVASTINQIPVDLIVDTGAAYSAVTRNFAARAKLPVEPARVGPSPVRRGPLAYEPDPPGAESIPADNAAITDLTLGAAHTTAASLPVLPGGSDGSDGGPVGIIGADYLIGHEIEFDSTDGRLNIFEPLGCDAAPVYWSREFGSISFTLDHRTGRITVPAVLDGVKLTAIIDTGSGVTAMPVTTARRKFDMGDDPTTLDKMPDRLDAEGQTIQSYRARFHRLVIGGLSVGNPTITLESVRASDQSVPGRHRAYEALPDLIIGIDLFRKLRTIIDYAGQTIYCTKAEPALL